MVYVRIRVPDEVAQGVTRTELANVVKRYYAQKVASAQTGNIDLQPADNGATRTQDKWIALYNSQKGEFKDKRMISAPDVYRIRRNGTPELVESVRDDFDKSWLVLSTRLIYNPDTLDARIVHNYGSKIVQPTERMVVIPVYQCAPLPEVLGTDQGLDYLRAYFNTKDSPDMIAKTLVALSGKKVDYIRLWTPDQESRTKYQERAAGFGFGGGGFGVDGSCRVVGVGGRSRGVSVKSAKPTRKK